MCIEKDQRDCAQFVLWYSYWILIIIVFYSTIG